MEANTIQASPAAAFDLAQYEAADTAILEVENVAGDGPLIGPNGQPVTIELYGPGSEQYVKVQAEIDRGNQERIFAAARGKTPKDAASEQRAAHTKKLVACTKAINNFPVDAKTLYANPRLGYIRNQVATFIEDWSHFLPVSAKS